MFFQVNFISKTEKKKNLKEFIFIDGGEGKSGGETGDGG